MHRLGHQDQFVRQPGQAATDNTYMKGCDFVGTKVYGY